MTGLLPGAVAALLSDWTGAERVGDASRLHAHMSFLAGTRGAPPIPGSSR